MLSIRESPRAATPAPTKALAMSGRPPNAFVTAVTRTPFFAVNSTNFAAFAAIFERSISIRGALNGLRAARPAEATGTKRESSRRGGPPIAIERRLLGFLVPIHRAQLLLQRHRRSCLHD